jgi:hypothetical protein
MRFGRFLAPDDLTRQFMEPQMTVEVDTDPIAPALPEEPAAQGATKSVAGPVGATTAGAIALGALALGAVAIGALAIGRVAIGRMAVGRLRLGRVSIDELVVRRFRQPD